MDKRTNTVNAMGQTIRDAGHVVRVADVAAVMDAWAPPSFAMEGDRVGLQLGRLDKPVTKVMVALDPYPQVVAEAVERQVDLLVTHHAMLFRPLQQIDTGTARGRAVQQALAADLAVFNAHTNLDIAAGGVNDVLAERLGLSDVVILDRLHNERLRKLVVFVPVDSHERVLQAVCEAGAGHIGAYSHCTFNTPGTGTFLPGQDTNPYIGKPGQLERTDEVRLETIVPESIAETVIRAMLEAHPYEEVAYDLYPLDIMGEPHGMGRVGNLPAPLAMREFAAHVRDRLGLSHIRFSGDAQMQVQRVAVLGGSGGRWAAKARQMGAEVLVTADCDHHTVAEAWQDGLAIVDATHAALEVPVVERMADVLKKHLGDAVEVYVRDTEEDPFQWI